MSAIFAGVQLCQSTPEVRQWIERNIPLSEFHEFNWHSGPPAIFAGLTYWPHCETNVTPRLNVLRWPSGASRWGTYHFLATDEQLADIRKETFGDPEEAESIRTVPGKLILHGSGEPITVSEMWLLAPRPISATSLGLTGRNRMWLCTLVDIRYWWNQMHCGNISDEDAGTWDNFFTVLRQRTGFATNAWDCPAVDAKWLFPHINLQDMNSLPLGLVIDAAAWNVGRKVSLDMEKSSEAYPAVLRIKDHTWHNTRLQSNLTNTAWYRLAGDEMELAARDLSSIIPEKVRMTFADGDEARDDLDVTVNTIVGYEDQSGVGTVVFHNRMDVSESSDAQRTALLLAVATAWLGFQAKATPDVVYSGHVKWLPEAMTDFIEWHELHDYDDTLAPDPMDGKVRLRKAWNGVARTRAVRPPVNLVVDDLWHGGSGGGSGSGGTTDANTIDCGDGSTPRTFTIQRINGRYVVEVAPEAE